MEGTTEETGGMLYQISLHNERHSCLSPTPWSATPIDTCRAHTTQNRFVLEGRNVSSTVEGWFQAFLVRQAGAYPRVSWHDQIRSISTPPAWDTLWGKIILPVTPDRSMWTPVRRALSCHTLPQAGKGRLSCPFHVLGLLHGLREQGFLLKLDNLSNPLKPFLIRKRQNDENQQSDG